VHSRAEASFGERGCGVQERASGVKDQIHVDQRGGQRGRVVQGQLPVGQVEAPGQRSDGRRAPAGEQGLVTALSSVLRDQGAGVPGGAVQHPGLCPAHG
jgi:hypothetical protein